METLGERLRRHRVDELGLTLRDLANRMDVAAMYVSQIERGKRQPRKEATLEAIAQAYALPFSEIEELSLRSRGGVELQFTERDVERDELALILARAWPDLTPERIEKLRRVMERTSDGGTD